MTEIVKIHGRLFLEFPPAVHVRFICISLHPVRVQKHAEPAEDDEGPGLEKFIRIGKNLSLNWVHVKFHEFINDGPASNENKSEMVHIWVLYTKQRGHCMENQITDIIKRPTHTA